MFGYSQSMINSSPTQKSHKSALIKCPYIQKHRVQSRNLANHIQNCRKKLSPNFLAQFETCRYNSLHILSIYEISSHEMMCPNRKHIANIQQRLFGFEKIIQEQQSTISGVQSDGKKSGKTHDKNQNKQKDVFQGPTKKRVKFTKQDDIQSIESDTQDYRNNKNDDRSQQDKNVIIHFQIKDQESQKATKISQSQQKKVNHQPKDNIKAYNQQQTNKNQKRKSSKNQKYKIQSLEDFNKKVFVQDNKNIVQQNKSFSNDKNKINNHQNQELHECTMCSSVLCDQKIKLWKNKKLVEYLRTYNKLQKQHQQIKQYINIMPSSLSKVFSRKGNNQVQIISDKKNQALSTLSNKNLTGKAISKQKFIAQQEQLVQSNIIWYDNKNNKQKESTKSPNKYQKQIRNEKNQKQKQKQKQNQKIKTKSKKIGKIFERQVSDTFEFEFNKILPTQFQDHQTNYFKINYQDTKHTTIAFFTEKDNNNNTTKQTGKNKFKISSEIFLDQNSMVMDGHPTSEKHLEYIQDIRNKGNKDQKFVSQNWVVLND